MSLANPTVVSGLGTKGINPAFGDVRDPTGAWATDAVPATAELPPASRRTNISAARAAAAARAARRCSRVAASAPPDPPVVEDRPLLRCPCGRGLPPLRRPDTAPPVDCVRCWDRAPDTVLGGGGLGVISPPPAPLARLAICCSSRDDALDSAPPAALLGLGPSVWAFEELAGVSEGDPPGPPRPLVPATGDPPGPPRPLVPGTGDPLAPSRAPVPGAVG
mmetsp:Transcript_50580/g.114846  ORF Transcript_50580/g.114846 Transcript_50580/m.114846 type:complete len:220 (-) Transcript_50580:346-1005(-)